MRKKEKLAHHILYGDWDDTYGNQVLVFLPEVGPSCEVFVMGGADYGGGVLYRFRADLKDIETADSESESDYDFYERVRALRR